MTGDQCRTCVVCRLYLNPANRYRSFLAWSSLALALSLHTCHFSVQTRLSLQLTLTVVSREWWTGQTDSKVIFFANTVRPKRDTM